MTSDLNDSDLIPVSLHGNDVEPLPAAAVSDGGKSTCHPGEGESQAGEKAPAAAAAGTLHAPGDEETLGEPDRNQPPDHSANCSSDMKGARSIALQQKDGAQNSDKEDTGSGSGDRCADHESQLDWYCSTEDRLICSHCAATGTCKSHTVTPVFKKAADMRVSENDTRTARARMLDALSDCTRAEPSRADTSAHCACGKEYTRALCVW